MQKLTQREREIYYYLTQGYTNKEIAKILTISHHTAKAHVKAILAKLGVKNRIYAAYIAGYEKGREEVLGKLNS